MLGRQRLGQRCTARRGVPGGQVEGTLLAAGGQRRGARDGGERWKLEFTVRATGAAS